MYEFRIDNVTAEIFESFETLVMFLIRFAYFCNAERDKIILFLANLDNKSGEYRLVRFGHDGLRHDFLEGYNRNRKDMDKDGNPKRFSVIHDGRIVDPDILWDAILQKREMVMDGGHYAAVRYLFYHRKGVVAAGRKNGRARFIHSFEYRNGAVPYTGKPSYRKYSRTRSLVRTMRCLSDPEYAEFTPNKGKMTKKKGRSPQNRSWKDNCRCQHQWQKHEKCKKNKKNIV